MRRHVAAFLRRFALYRRLRRAHEAGWAFSMRRWQLERLILRTRPIPTRPAGSPGVPCEVRMLVYEADWLMALWSAKSFYLRAGVDWPLVWLQGGPIGATVVRRLREHFPDSRFVSLEEADAVVEPALARHGWTTSLHSRRAAVMLRKLIDLAFFGSAERLLSLDSDVLFFRFPREIVDWADGGAEGNLFNRDLPSTFNLLSDEGGRARHGVALFKGHNAGLALLNRKSIDLTDVDHYLQDPELRLDERTTHLHAWLLEQSLHGLIGGKYPSGLLPDTYRIAPGAGLVVGKEPVVARHYAGASRPLLFTEGIPALIGRGFLEELRP